jgi:hypothetical protein
VGKVLAGITMSIDGYITGPNDGPGVGLGEGGERLHEWVFGGSWRYEDAGRGEPAEKDSEWLDSVMTRSPTRSSARWRPPARRTST